MALITQTPGNYYSNINDNYGEYQFTSLSDVIDQFMIAYVGDNKVIPRVNAYEVQFHAKRALQELSFDTFKSCKSQEITLQPNLQMVLPQDYVNYVKVSWVAADGIKRRIHPTTRTSNPKPKFINENGGYEVLATATSVTNTSNDIVLDGEYPNILPDMTLQGAMDNTGLNGFTVVSNTVSNGITTLTMSGPATASFTGNQLLNFTYANGELAIDNEPFYLTSLGNITISEKMITSFVTGGLDANISQVKVGMKIYHPNFPVGTLVTAIDTNPVSGAAVVISLSEDAIAGYTTAYDTVGIFCDENPDSDTWTKYRGVDRASENNRTVESFDVEDISRYGLDPQYANVNGNFYIDCDSGKIHFSSDLVGKTIVLDYISDTLGSNKEMKVHKFAEEAMYKWVAHAILSSTMNVPEGLVARYKKERFAAVRTAKLRLSSIKLEEITQILRGKSKQIKH
jgi:hypothetical protein